MSTTVESQIKALTDQGATLLEAVKGLKERIDSPVYPTVHAARDGGAISYWESPSRRKAMRMQMMREAIYPEYDRTLGMPAGYKNDVWKSMGGFLQDLVKTGKSTEFIHKHAGVFKAVQGLNEQVASEGGYLVLPEFNQNIFERVYDNDLFGKLDLYTVAGNGMRFLRNAEVSRVHGSRAGGLRGYWVDEGDSGTKSKPTLKAIQLNLKKLMIVVYLTQEIIDDAGGALESYVARKAAEEFNFMLGDAVFNGPGGGVPVGFLKSPALLSIAAEGGQTAATIVTANIDKMWARRWAPGSYEWYTNQDTHAQLAGLFRAAGSANSGELVYSPPGGVSDAPYATLKGRPVVETEFNNTLGGQGDLCLADLSQMLAITKGGVNQAISSHVEFLTDQQALRFTMRVDFRPWEDTPITPFKGTNTQSSFVTLDPR